MEILIEKYKINNSKIKKDIKISFITDIHYMDSIADGYNNKIIEQVKKMNPNYIVLGGDYFCGLGQFTFKVKSSMDCLRHLLSGLSKLAPVILILGNHDLSIKEDQVLRQEFLKLKSKNIYPLDNDSILFDDIKFSGFFANRKSYAISKISSKKVKIIIDDFNKCNFKIAENKCNIFLHHIPDTIFDERVKENLKEIYKYDLILSGHAHNGWMSLEKEQKIKAKIEQEQNTKKRQKLELKSYQGFCESILNNPPFVRKYARGIHDVDGTKIIISKGITTGLKWGIGNKLLINTNKEYSYITEIDIKAKK